jgi:GNAT superfamily N-acetyltransferase
VNWPEDIDTVRRVFQEYRQWVADHRDRAASAESRVSAGLSEIDKLIEELPGAYGPPRGEVLLAFEKQDLTCCGVLRELEPRVGDIRRLYVRADHRGPVFGLRFVSTMLSRARELGYERVRADTLPTMAAAIQFYQDSGFDPIPAYWSHPVSGALFFECDLGKQSKAPRGHRTSKSKRSGT